MEGAGGTGNTSEELFFAAFLRYMNEFQIRMVNPLKDFIDNADFFCSFDPAKIVFSVCVSNLR